MQHVGAFARAGALPAQQPPLALHMMYDRMAPEEPMSAPTVVSRSFCSMKPSAQSA